MVKSRIVNRSSRKGIMRTVVRDDHLGKPDIQLQSQCGFIAFLSLHIAERSAEHLVEVLLHGSKCIAVDVQG